jgi:hypothetical protein
MDLKTIIKGGLVALPALIFATSCHAQDQDIIVNGLLPASDDTYRTPLAAGHALFDQRRSGESG